MHNTASVAERTYATTVRLIVHWLIAAMAPSACIITDQLPSSCRPTGKVFVNFDQIKEHLEKYFSLVHGVLASPLTHAEPHNLKHHVLAFTLLLLNASQKLADHLISLGLFSLL